MQVWGKVEEDNSYGLFMSLCVTLCRCEIPIIVGVVVHYDRVLSRRM